MSYIVFHGTQVSTVTAKFHLLRGITEAKHAMSGSSLPSLSYFHSLATATRGVPKLTMYRALAQSSCIARQNVPSFQSRWSGLSHAQRLRSSSIMKCHRTRNLLLDEIVTTPSIKRANQKNSTVLNERVYTSMTKRFLLQSKYHRSTSTKRPGPAFSIPPSSLIRSNTIIRSPYTMLSSTHHFSDGSGGPSRFPQVNPPNKSTSSRLAQGVGMLGAASVLFGKTKYILAALKVTKLASLGSMVLSIGAYSMLFGWPYAIGVVGLIFCHECGHLAVMLNRGIPFSPMVFIPFGKFSMRKISVLCNIFLLSAVLK